MGASSATAEHVRLPGERAAAGRQARRLAPRTSHAGWRPAPDRRDPVDVLREQAASRVPELVPIRAGRMLVSPFTFFRGAAAVMAADLAATPVSGLRVQACGDAHLLNFGAYRAPDRKLVFDVNDFDETLLGPWEWDLKRLAASIEIAGRVRGEAAGQRRRRVLGACRAYRTAMRQFAAMGTLDVWYARIDEDVVVREFLPGGDATLRRALTRARGRGSLRAMTKLTERVDGRVRFISDPPLLVPVRELLSSEAADELETTLEALLLGYRGSLDADRRHLLDGYHVVDLARKVVGVGSVGTRAWVVLLHGRDAGDPLVMQAKEAQESVLARWVGPGAYVHEGERVVQGQRLIQAASDVLLGWDTVSGFDGRERDFYVRQLWDGKYSPDVETMPAQRLDVYVSACAWTLARGHARSGDRIAIAAYVGKGDVLDVAIAEFARDYADQNERDHARLEAAVRAGHVPARTGI